MISQNRNFKLKIKDVRCFSGEWIFDIRPLTFLIGANSTGKTTVMSCFSTIYNLISQEKLRSLDFNKEPYSMGSFIDIVRRSKAKEGTEGERTPQSFELGISHDNNIKYNFCFTENDAGTESVIKQAEAKFKNISLFCEKKESKILFSVKDNKTNKEKSFFLDDNISPSWVVTEPYIPFQVLFRLLYRPHNMLQYAFDEKLNHSHNITVKDFLDRFLMYVVDEESSPHSWMGELFEKHIFSLAPVRSKPQRTYNPIREAPTPEGNEIPVLLSNLKGIKEDWKSVHKNLIDFGKASGLFSDIEVRKFGKTKGYPFQLQFKVRGIESNIIDTGYGLSQILPLLVRIFSSHVLVRKHLPQTGTWFLLQQPEVHLHPEAQAELASLFVKSVKANNSFLIETHSDYILDRTRIEVRKGGN